MLKVNNENSKTKCEICSNLTIKTSVFTGVFIVDFEHISYLFLVFLMLTLNMYVSAGRNTLYEDSIGTLTLAT